MFHVPGKLLGCDLSMCRKRATLCSTVSIAPNAVSESENSSECQREGRKLGPGAGESKEEGREHEKQGRGRREEGRSYLVLSYLSSYLQLGVR